jgi:hypothetical protein
MGARATTNGAKRACLDGKSSLDGKSLLYMERYLSSGNVAVI